MGLFHSRVNARRYRVLGELPDDYREVYRDRLSEFAFRDPPQVDKTEIQGWTLVNDVTSTDFSDFNTWYIDCWIVFGLRVDKRVLPAKVFKATLENRCREWAKDHGVARVPASIRRDFKEVLEIEWLRKVMPRTLSYEIAWNIQTNQLWVSTHGDAACDRIRKRFFRTFAHRLIPFSPLEWVGDSEVVNKLLAGAPMSLGSEHPRAPGPPPAPGVPSSPETSEDPDE